MKHDKYGLSNLEFGGKAYGGKTLKQELADLIARGTVLPSSKLAQVKEEGLQRVRDFEAAAQDEERHQRTEVKSGPGKINPAYTREPFTE